MESEIERLFKITLLFSIVDLVTVYECEVDRVRTVVQTKKDKLRAMSREHRGGRWAGVAGAPQVDTMEDGLGLASNTFCPVTRISS